MPGLIALDLATRTGWAYLASPDAEPRSGVYRLPSTGDEIGRYLGAFEDWLVDMVTANNPERVVFEAPLFLGGGNSNIVTARKLMCLAGVTELVCHRKGVACWEGHLQEVKKFFAGHGRADKDAMVDAARRRGWQVSDDNEADALGLMCWACSKFWPKSKHGLPPLLRGAA